MWLFRLQIVQRCSRFGSSNSNDYISLINLLADFYNTVATRRFLTKSLDDFLYTHEPLYMYMATLKWECNEIVWPFLFYESNPPGPLINKPKWFCEISDSTQAKTAWCQKI